jgi:hypothetical protein
MIHAQRCHAAFLWSTPSWRGHHNLFIVGNLFLLNGLIKSRRIGECGETEALRKYSSDLAQDAQRAVYGAEVCAPGRMV